MAVAVLVTLAGYGAKERAPKALPACWDEIKQYGDKAVPYSVRLQGDSVLKQVAEEVPLDLIKTPEFQAWLDKLTATFIQSGGVGIAAPQAGFPLRVFLVEVADRNQARYPDMPPQEFTVLINPTIEIVDKTLHPYEEGCLSVPDTRLPIQRPRHIKVRYRNRKGEPRRIEVVGLASVIYQHEMDHLNGVLITDPR